MSFQVRKNPLLVPDMSIIRRSSYILLWYVKYFLCDSERCCQVYVRRDVRLCNFDCTLWDKPFGIRTGHMTLCSLAVTCCLLLLLSSSLPRFLVSCSHFPHAGYTLERVMVHSCMYWPAIRCSWATWSLVCSMSVPWGLDLGASKSRIMSSFRKSYYLSWRLYRGCDVPL